MRRTDPVALERLRVLDVIGSEIALAVQDLYGRVAENPNSVFHFPTGRRAAVLAGYAPDELEGAPPEALARFAGVGCPLKYVDLEEGARVFDLGSGGGTDLFLAANRVGPGGRVVGLDVTPAMVERTSTLAQAHPFGNVEVHAGGAPDLSEVEGPFDVVTSNGVVNLIPDKEATLARLHELLRPGGRLALADVVLSTPPAAACLSDASLWAECLVGAFTEEAYLAALEQVGFDEVRVHARRDYFATSPSAKTRETARDLGAFTWVLTARRPD